MDTYLNILNRSKNLFDEDISLLSENLKEIITGSSFLVIGGSGSIGQATVLEIFKRHPAKLHVVDVNENNLVELVRNIRSSEGYISGEFKTFCLDISSLEYDAFIKFNKKYDYVLNLSALKHVRSEKDPFTLMRLIKVNILNTKKTLQQSIETGVKKYFAVSTDKAANPVNMMGASKKIMELFLMRASEEICISTARFANVAFSDGSLLHSFKNRLDRNQPFVAPTDIKRYFITPQESGELCLISSILGENREILFPKLDSLELTSFVEIAERFLAYRNLKPYMCSSEDEAREISSSKASDGFWPCYFSESDTTGEKYEEEFYTGDEEVDLETYKNLGIIKNKIPKNLESLELFTSGIENLLESGYWTKENLVEQFKLILPDFNYVDKGKYLDSKM
tara:strand:- start:25014 stop:26201 length:1188 start_codon:yes stop_codon:yes gene_type:complete